MKFLLVLIALSVSSAYASQSLLKGWYDFKRTHAKTYASKDEELTRFNIWKSNLNYINKHNADADNGVHSFRLGMNKFGDLTNQEFVSIYNGYNASLRQNLAGSSYLHVFNKNIAVPDSVDWRQQGYVTDVKDQGQCGSCWSFSTTGSLEGQHFKATGKLVSLSEQNLVDCSTSFGNQGCNGGLMDQAFAYIKSNNGIDTEASYPYTAADGKCSFNPSNVGATDNGYVDVESGNEDALKQAVGTVGPISVAIDASHLSFQFYKSGVYYEFFCSATRLDHGVLAVGYGTESGKDFWLVKNSWGPAWGDQGYIKMSRNRKNNCGIATSASYPTV